MATIHQRSLSSAAAPAGATTARPRRGAAARHWLGSLLGGWVLGLIILAWCGPAAAAMDYAKQVLIGADFHGAELQAVTFNLTNLRDADFSGADLRGASLFGAKLQDANFQGLTCGRPPSIQPCSRARIYGTPSWRMPSPSTPASRGCWWTGRTSPTCPCGGCQKSSLCHRCRHQFPHGSGYPRHPGLLIHHELRCPQPRAAA